jgi:Flp pilus assembly pilin Flp
MTHRTEFAAYLKKFHAEESGAATVDWVVGVAAAVSLTMAVTSSINEGVVALSDKIADSIGNLEFGWDAAPSQTSLSNE